MVINLTTKVIITCPKYVPGYGYMTEITFDNGNTLLFPHEEAELILERFERKEEN